MPVVVGRLAESAGQNCALDAEPALRERLLAHANEPP